MYCSYCILITYCLFIYCNFLVTIGLNYVMQNQLGLNTRDMRSGRRAGALCEGMVELYIYIYIYTQPLRNSVTNGERARIMCNIILVMTYMILFMLEKQ